MTGQAIPLLWKNLCKCAEQQLWNGKAGRGCKGRRAKWWQRVKGKGVGKGKDLTKVSCSEARWVYPDLVDMQILS